MDHLEHWRSHPKSKYFYSHVTDFIRFCVLYKSGGIYSDFDALQLQKLDTFGKNFIGRDSSGAKGKCEWCLPGGDIYLAPGVMGAEKGHWMVREALKVGFVGSYDPEVFNGVGPVAVTKAYKRGKYYSGDEEEEGEGGDIGGGRVPKGGEVNLLPRHVLYPYSYLDSWKVFKSARGGEDDGLVLAEALQRKSGSLHLYGHQTKHLEIEKGSVLEAVLRMQSVVDFEMEDNRVESNSQKLDEKGGTVVTYRIQAPRYLGVRRFVEEVKNLRVVVGWSGNPMSANIGTKSNYSKQQNGLFKAVLSTKNGGLLHIPKTLATQQPAFNKKEWTTTITLQATTPAEINLQLSRLLYYAQNLPEGTDCLHIDLFLSREASSASPSFPGKPITSSSIPIYNINQLVTLVVKTMDRMPKVFALIESTQARYPNLPTIVSNDGPSVKNLNPSSKNPSTSFFASFLSASDSSTTTTASAAAAQKRGPKRGFYYLPLGYDVGLSKGRNTMVQLVKSKYVLTLDDDFTMDENSVIEGLIHVLETPQNGQIAQTEIIKQGITSDSENDADSNSIYYDIAAAKNPEDENKFEFDFCGVFHVSSASKTLALLPLPDATSSSPNSNNPTHHHSGCHQVDFVPNIFLARTKTLQTKIQWDPLLKLGEHEDFFYRAKQMGVRTLTCPGVSFNHKQVEHWLGKTEYDRMRGRVFGFLKLSLRKHGLSKLVSFGRTTMDLVCKYRIIDGFLEENHSMEPALI
jgi:GT2 family glycosyltransferase